METTNYCKDVMQYGNPIDSQTGLLAEVSSDD